MKSIFYILLGILVGCLSYSVYSSGGPVAKLWLMGVVLIAAHSYYCNRTSKRGPY